MVTKWLYARQLEIPTAYKPASVWTALAGVRITGLQIIHPDPCGRNEYIIERDDLDLAKSFAGSWVLLL